MSVFPHHTNTDEDEHHEDEDPRQRRPKETIDKADGGVVPTEDDLVGAVETVELRVDADG